MLTCFRLVPRAQLSPECKDLMNRIFVIDAKKRITLEDIEAHPWYSMPLPPRLQAQLDRMDREQVTLDRHTRSRNVSAVSPP